MDIYIYSDTLELLGILDGFISLIWIKRYHEAGSFELYVPASEKHAELLKPYRYIYRPDVGEAMYISGIEDSDDPDSGKCIRVSGYGTEGILRKRIIHAINRKAAPMLNTVNSILEIAPIPKFEVNVGDVLDTVSFEITSDYMGVNLEDFLYSGCAQGDRDIGYKIDLDPENGRLWLYLYAGRELTDEVVFGDDLGNINNMLYSYSEDGCCNTIICKCATPDDDVEWEGTLPSFTLGDAEGLERNEMYMTVDPIVKNGIRWHSTGDDGYWEEYKYLDRDATETAMKNAAEAASSDFTENYSADAICTGYRSEWAVGDIVVVRNDFRGDNLVKRIEEVQETYDTSGVTITPTFGEPLKTILDLIGDTVTSSTVKTVVSSSIPTDVSAFNNNSGYLTNALVSGAQTTTSTEDGGKNVYTFTDAAGNTSELAVYNGSRGSKGDKGENATTTEVVSTSANGLAPQVTDTSKFLKGDGTWDMPNALVSGAQTTASTEDGGKNVYTFTDAAGNTSELAVYNGSRGSKGDKGDKGDTATTAVEVNSSSSKARLWEDGEGGNLRLTSPDGNHYIEMDLYDNANFRIYAGYNDSGVLMFPASFNFSNSQFNISGNVTNADTVDGYHATDFIGTSSTSGTKAKYSTAPFSDLFKIF